MISRKTIILERIRFSDTDVLVCLCPLIKISWKNTPTFQQEVVICHIHHFLSPAERCCQDF